MKKIALIICSFFAITYFSACSNNDAAKVNLTEFNKYVDSVDNLKPVYTVANWTEIEQGYAAKENKVEKEVSKLDEADKAALAESKKQYEALKAKYETGIKEANDPEVIANKARMELRNKLLGEGNPGPNNDWSFVTKDNVVTTYKNFVDRVRDNGDNYSDADWVETRSLWKALNDRKDAINKDISTLDKITIDHLKVAFLAVKAVNKPVSQLK